MPDELPYLMRTYAPPALGFVRGEGAYLYDRRGRRYLDFISGLGVNLLGHCPPAVVRAIRAQAGRLLHASNLYRIDQQVQLAQRLCEASFGERAFFCNSGGEATDTMIKIARRYAWLRGQWQRTRVLAFEGAFHGRTYGALSATARRAAREGFGPVVPGIAFAPFNDLAAAAARVDARTCLVLVEPVLGEGGIVPGTRAFLEGLRRLCDAHGALLAFDEVQSGLGRTGRRFAYEHFGVVPDLMSLGKGLAGGLPMAAVVARGEAAAALTPGTHGSTFGGNPLSSAAALVVTRTVFRERFLRQVTDRGAFLLRQLEECLAGRPRVRAVRGLGLMVGIELDASSAPYVERCRDRGLLVSGAAETVLRLLPPLIVTRRQCEAAAAILAAALEG